MMSKPETSAELFLMIQIYESKDRPHGRGKYVYDDEHIHYALLKILSENSPTFVKSILKTSSLPKKKASVQLKPNSGLFDLLFVVDDEHTYCEVKVWSDLNSKQFDRQQQFLATERKKGMYILLTKAAKKWSPNCVREKSNGNSHVVGFDDLMTGLNSLGDELPRNVSELAVAYLRLLKHLNSRWLRTPIAP